MPRNCLVHPGFSSVFDLGSVHYQMKGFNLTQFTFIIALGLAYKRQIQTADKTATMVHPTKGL